MAASELPATGGGGEPYPKFSPYYALGVLRVTTAAETGAEFRTFLADDGFSAAECELWALLFETFVNGRHTAASDALLKMRAEEYQAATFNLFEHTLGDGEETGGDE